MMNLLFATRLTPSKWSSGRLMFVIFSALLICAHWSPLAYGATATAVVQAVNSATPQLFYPVVYNSYSDAPRTWKSTLTVQNPSQTTNAAVQLTFYNENGQAITPNGLGSITNNFTLAPKASVTIPIETVNGLTTNARYTVVATSDQPLTGVNWVRVFNSSTNTESHETFIGFAPQTATTVYLPSLVKAANGFSSNVAIQNLSNSTISNAQLTIWDQNGNQALQLQAPPIAPYSAWYPSFSALTNGFSGALSVSASGPLALVDLQIGGSNGVTLLAYRGAATGAQTLYAPFLTTQSSASAALTIQNTSNSQAATVSVTNADAVDNTQVNIPPRASRSISYSANSHAAQFSATITANQAVIAIVTQQTSSGGGYTYPAFEQSLTSFALPLEVKAYQNAGSNANFNNVTTLFNPGVTTAQVVINYSNNSTTQHVVNPGQYLSIAAATLGNLSSNFAGSAFVTSSQPLFAFNGMSGQNANGDLLAAYGAVAPQTPAAIITKSASVAYLKPGDPLTYTLSVAAGASGGSALIVDLLPSQLLTHSYSVGASVVVTPTGNEDYRWTAAVPAGGGQIVVHGIVDPALANDLTLVNTAAITVNSNSASSSANVIVDATPPDTTIASKPTNPSNNPAPTFSFSANDGAGSGVASYAYQLDNGAWTSCSAGCQLPSVSDGSHTLNVRALDRVGHVDPTPASYTWTVDTTPPTSPVLTAPPNGSTINNIQTVTLTWNAVADADRAGYKVNFNGVTTDVGNTTNYNVGPVANGVYTWTVAAYDTLGNTGAFAGVATFTINVNAPQRLSLSPQANSHTAPVNTSVAITLSKPINASTVNTRTLAIHAMQTGRRLQAYNTNGATSAFSPTPPFKPGELIEASATSGLQDTDGFALFPPTVWHFRAGVHGGTGQFTVGNTFGSNHAADAAIGDVDGDGDVDLIVADYSGPNKLYLNDGDGTFDTTSYVVGPGNDVTWAVALGDLNGDGKLDLVVANLQGANVVYMNDGVGNPFDTISYTYSSSPLDNGQALALGDVDGDGDLDLAVGHNATLSTKLYINDGSGNPFDTTNDNIETPGTRAGDMSFGDVNNDGRLDLIMAGDTGNKVLLNDGSGNPFDTTSYSFGIGSNSTTKFEMVAGDFNGDQKLDVAISHRGSSRANIVYLNDGSGNPFDTLTNTVGTGNDCTTALTAGDVDGDGDLDLALGNWGSGCVGGGQDAVYLNDGDGTFDTTAYNFGSNSFANMTHALEMADLDGDGDLDIVAAIWGNTPQISYLNANEPLPGTATPTPTATAPVTPTATSTPTPTTQPGTPTDTPTLTPTTQPGTATVTPTPTLTPTPTVTPIATCSLVVLNTNDSGAGSLRQAIADASATCNQIAFANGLTGQTIHLASPLTIAKDVAINGSGRKLTISGDTNSDGSGDVAVFTINAGNVQLANLTIANGFGADGLGGGVSISPGAHVQITQSTLRDNTSDNGALASGGGGIYNTGVLTLTNSTISGNQAANIAGLGGGIHSGFGSVTTIRYSTITGNSAPSDGLGGGINVEGGSVTLIGSIVSGNSAPTGPEIAVNNGGTLVINGRNVIGANGNAGLDGATPGATDLVPAGAVSTVLNPTLADNGGDTFTHALVVGGAAYDAIGVNSLGCGVTITVDQRNITRPSGAGCDVGAVESTTTIPTPTPTLPTSDATAVAQPGQPASLNYTDPSGGGVVVQIPAGAINQPTTFLYADHETPSHTGAFQFAGRTFTLTAYRDNSAVTGFTFQQPVTLVIDYTDSDVAGLDENHLALFFYDVANGVWSDQGITIVSRDLVNNRITVQINHLTEFAMGTTNRSYMPVITK